MNNPKVAALVFLTLGLYACQLLEIKKALDSTRETENNNLRVENRETGPRVGEVRLLVDCCSCNLLCTFFFI